MTSLLVTWGDGMTRPRLLDLFCGAGGAAMGYSRAGFDVVGVDISPQPHYPFPRHFIEGDALATLDHLIAKGSFLFGHDGALRLDDFDVIHASPPCQAYSALRGFTSGYPMLIPVVRAALAEAGLPYVIENVIGAPLVNPIRLCGSSFGLHVWRHRIFEMTHPPVLVPTCSHFYHPAPIDVTGTGGLGSKPRTAPGGGKSRKPRNLGEARAAMGIDWMTRSELAEAIPPVYTEWVGAQLLRALGVAA